MNAPEVVRRYAATLLDAAVEKQIGDQVRGDVEGLTASLEASPELVDFLKNPLVNAPVKRQALEQIFEGKVQQLTANFLALVTERKRSSLLPEMLVACLELFDEQAGIITAQIRSSVELDAGQATRLRQRLSAYTGKDVRLEVQIDRQLKGGLVARIGDTVFDGSLTTHLQRLRRQLLGS